MAFYHYYPFTNHHLKTKLEFILKGIPRQWNFKVQ